jgi:hypothetical protein
MVAEASAEGIKTVCERLGFEKVPVTGTNTSQYTKNITDAFINTMILCSELKLITALSCMMGD